MDHILEMGGTVIILRSEAFQDRASLTARVGKGRAMKAKALDAQGECFPASLPLCPVSFLSCSLKLCPTCTTEGC